MEAAATLSVNPENTCSSPDPLQEAKILNGGGGGDGEIKERSCDSLVMCIVTTLNQGLRNGGGIGDILRPPSSKVSLYGKSKQNNLLYLWSQ